MSIYDDFRRSLAEGRPVALASVVAGPLGLGDRMLIQRDASAVGRLGTPELACRVAGDAAARLRSAEETGSDTVTYEQPEGRFEVFIDLYPAPPHLVIVGASHAAGPLVRLGKMLGYRVTVADARSAFAQAERFPEADAVLHGWPQDVLPGVRIDDATYVVLLSHDPRFDDPTLRHVLPTAAPYVGAIGSRKTQRERFERLRGQGFTEEQLARIHGPVGLDLGGRSPEETALAIMAEITAARYGAGGGRMRDRT